jgi:hypothetical protein
MLRESPGISGLEAGEIALRSLEAGLFYIFTDPSTVESARQRFNGFETGVPPGVGKTFSGPLGAEALSPSLRRVDG